MSPQALQTLSRALFLTALCVCHSQQVSDHVTTGPPSKPYVQSASGNVTDAGTEVAVASFNVSSCVLTTGAGVNDSINLMPLAGLHRNTWYTSTYIHDYNEYQIHWNYSYNPCTPASLPTSNPHATNLFGDGCIDVVMCKYNNLGPAGPHYFTLGVQREEKIEVEQIKQGNATPIFALVYSGIKSLRIFKTRVKLICDPKRQRPDEVLFEIVSDDSLKLVVAELHHQCCCVGACLLNQRDLLPPSNSSGASHELILVIVGTLVGLLLVAVIGGLCYFKKTHVYFYSQLPDPVFNIKFAPSGSHDRD